MQAGSVGSSTHRNRKAKKWSTKGGRGKVKSSQDEIRVLRNIAVMLLTRRPKLAWGSCCTHGIPVQSVKLIYTDPLITIMSAQSLRLILNKQLIHAHPWRGNVGRLSALCNRSMGVTLASSTLPGHHLVSLDYSSLDLELKNKEMQSKNRVIVKQFVAVSSGVHSLQVSVRDRCQTWWEI